MTVHILLDHEKLDVYNISVEFVVLADELISSIPRGKGYIIDQLQRAALSISLNIAEGAGEFSFEEKVRFYRIAKRSATECVAILNICLKLNLIDSEKYLLARELILRLVSMLIKMAKRSG
jgi:four helix bundle protein